MPQPANVFFLSHGGGPLPLLGEPSHKDMVETLGSNPYCNHSLSNT